MARPKKDVRYDATAETIRRYFEQSWALRGEQRAASGLISDNNAEMAAAGVHPGVMSRMRRLRALPDGRRGFEIWLERRYLDVLEEELHDPTFKEPAREDATVPFARKSATAA
jgi:hypothetical protein